MRTLSVLSVTDTGIGIRAEDQEVVFEEFRQVEGTTGDYLAEGTGLGLAITKRLVEQQGGKSPCRAKPAKAADLLLPCPWDPKHPRKSSRAQSSGNRLTAAGGSRGRPLILIVDDEVPARELLASYLEPEYRIAMAESGVEALKKAQQLRPDAITLDVLMPGGTGFETLVALREMPETANISDHHRFDHDQKQVGFALGAADYLIKPIRKPALLETIRKHVPTSAADDDTSILRSTTTLELWIVGGDPALRGIRDLRACKVGAQSFGSALFKICERGIARSAHARHGRF